MPPKCDTKRLRLPSALSRHHQIHLGFIPIRDHFQAQWPKEDLKELLILSGHNREVNSVAWSPDGQRLATASRDHTAKVWDAASGKELLTLSGHNGDVTSAAWRAKGQRLATAGADKIVQIYATDIHDLMELARQRTAHPSDEGCKKYLGVNKCPTVPELPWW